MKLAQIIPKQNILVVDQGDMETQGSNTCAPEINLDSSLLSSMEKTKLLDLLAEYSDVFATVGTPGAQNHVVKHTIKTTGLPIRQPLRRASVTLKETVDKEGTKMLENRIIRPSASPWSSPVVMVKKQDGTWRFCIDYRKLNAVTHQDAYPLPRIDETLDSLSGSTYFTTLDLAAGYWQVGIKECDKEKTAFSTRSGHYEINMMLFGLTNAPATFQRLMECVLACLTGEQCLIYLDDIIVFSSTFEEHLTRLSNVFIVLRKAGLKLKPSICFFVQKEVHYLGHVVSAAGVSPDPAKVEVVSSYPVPTDVKQLRQFLGLANYYHRFVPAYSMTAEPLHKLLRKGNTYNWNTACQEAFVEVKHRLITPPILIYPDFKLPFLLYTDASNFALGAVLSPVQNGKEQVVCYWSRQLTKPECGYSTMEREALAAVSAVKEFYPYLYGTSFKLITDHNPLTSLKGLKDVGGRLTRWMLFLQQFNFQFQYRPGKSLGNVDALSRAASIIPGHSSTSTSNGEAQLNDEQLAPIVKTLNLKDGTSLPSNVAPGLCQAFLHQNTLYHHFWQSYKSPATAQLVVPSGMRDIILNQLHNQAGHWEFTKQLQKYKRDFIGPAMNRTLRTGCVLVNHVKNVILLNLCPKLLWEQL